MSETFSAPDSTNFEALKRVTHEIECGSARLGWDQPATIYALVATSTLLDTPGLPEDVAQQIRSSWDGQAEHLSAILQDSLGTDDLEEVLPQLAWPETVTGAVISAERIIVPPEVEDAAPEDPEEALEFITNHPTRTDVRLTIGVLRSGESWCMVRARTFDTDDRVGTGENLVPALVESLRLGFSDNARQEETKADSPQKE